LAREHQHEPFSFAPVEILKGHLDGTKSELFLDSVTRRMLAGDSKRTVVLVQERVGGPWRSLGLASAEYQAVVRHIVLLGPEWQTADGKLRRVEFFLPLFGHEDPLINELAYLEMGRAPYATIKRLSRIVSREYLGQMLSSRQYTEWRSLAILLLAHRGEPQDREYITESFRNAGRFGLTTSLAAWAAASIELDGAEAVSFIDDRYFRNPNRKKEELAEVLRAMSLHGTEGHTHLRDQIVESYGLLLEFHPEMAANVAKDLLVWKRFELREKLANLEATNDELVYAERKMIRQYLRLSATFNKSARIDD
jgi:hypothetical protein